MSYQKIKILTTCFLLFFASVVYGAHEVTFYRGDLNSVLWKITKTTTGGAKTEYEIRLHDEPSIKIPFELAPGDNFKIEVTYLDGENPSYVCYDGLVRMGANQFKSWRPIFLDETKTRISCIGKYTN